ncbi:MAG TPA: VOC family protein [Usitatibacter sp.]|nr:VOC family protein [Usitatibacter sp.]
MLDHIGIGCTDLAASKAFFLAALAPIDVRVVMDAGVAVGLGQGQKPDFWLGPASAKPAPLHLAFTATRRAQVDEFHKRALAAGAKDNGPPGLRVHYHPTYYAAFVIGPDGHNVEVVCHAPEP